MSHKLSVLGQTDHEIELPSAELSDGHDHGDHDHDHDHDHEAHLEAAAGPIRVTEGGKVFFRSIDQLEDTPEFRDWAHREFPQGAAELTDDVSRRSFLQLMGAGVALAGFGTGCLRRPEEHIIPYAKRPEDVLPGLPLHYATATSIAGEVHGLVVESHDGRPTKIEGNTLHPASIGATSAIAQGFVLDLYDPDRLASPLKGATPTTWTEADAALTALVASHKATGGSGLFVLQGRQPSPTFALVKAAAQASLPNATFLEWEPATDDAVRAGTRLAFGEPLQPVYRIEAADVILTADADLFAQGPMHVRYAREWASRRNPEDRRGMNRLWVLEPTWTPTGSVADHRLRVRGEQIGTFLRVLAAALTKQGVSVPAGVAASGDGGFDPKFVEVLAQDLAARKGRSVIAVGRRQPAAVQALALALNEALGNFGRTLLVAKAPYAPSLGHVEALRKLTGELEAGKVETLVLLGGNPVYDAPADLKFEGALKKAKSRIHLTVTPNETTALCDWALPEAHFLEAWGDVENTEGTVSVTQPLVAPIFEGKSAIELLALLSGAPKKGYDLVHDRIVATAGEPAFQRALHDGVLAGTGGAYVIPAVDAGAVAQAVALLTEPAPATAQDPAVEFTFDGKVFDGRFANNAWLQELPDPMTKMTWTNTVTVSPKTAKALGVKSRDLVRLDVTGGTITGAIWEQPGTAEGTIIVALGYGRTKAGRVGNGRGFNAYALRTTQALEFARGAKIVKLGGKAMLPTTQDHHFIEGRPLVREATLKTHRDNPAWVKAYDVHPPLISLYEDFKYEGQQWGLAVDLNSCVGCNACMVACQSENNIAVVGPEQVFKGREMHWMRLDRYFVGHADDEAALDNPEIVHQPMMCQHCENAPCENVCPVAATVHSKEDGLNDMVYNRCIGTRYCANNCPWKVRRFNFLDYHAQNEGQVTEIAKLRFNPDVTVRARGVIEKCSFCVQRIHQARRDAKVNGNGLIPDGGVVSACQQVCPTGAIVFGDINDPASRVSRLKKNARNYVTLEEVNTRPRASYLARIRNPHPALA